MSEESIPIFPRALTPFESRIIAELLPERISPLADIRRRIERSLVIGNGRWGDGDLMLFEQDAAIDLKLGMASILAYGEISLGEELLTVTIHEPNLDYMIEIQFQRDLSGIPADQTATVKTYSGWLPGTASPIGGGRIREVVIGNRQYIFAIDFGKHKLWLHHSSTGFNQLLPITGLYGAMARSKPATQTSASKTQAFTSNVMFERLREATDSEIIEGLLRYNAESRKFDATELQPPAPAKRGWFARLLGGGNAG